MKGALLILVFFFVGEASATFLSTSCPVNMTVPVDTEAKATKKGCYDLYGDGPYPGGHVLGNECISYICESNGKSGKKEKFSWMSVDMETCCVVGDEYFAMGCIVRSEQEGPCTTLSFVCEYDNTAMQMAVMPQLNVTGCSVNGDCLPFGETSYWPEKCSELNCWDEPSGPTLHYESYMEGCNCCLFEDSFGHSHLIEDGEYTYNQDMIMIECCKGHLNYVFPYSVNGTLPWEGNGNTGSSSSTSSTTASTSSTSASTSSTTTNF